MSVRRSWLALLVAMGEIGQDHRGRRRDRDTGSATDDSDAVDGDTAGDDPSDPA